MSYRDGSISSCTSPRPRRPTDTDEDGPKSSSEEFNSSDGGYSDSTATELLSTRTEDLNLLEPLYTTYALKVLDAVELLSSARSEDLCLITPMSTEEDVDSEQRSSDSFENTETDDKGNSDTERSSDVDSADPFMWAVPRPKAPAKNTLGDSKRRIPFGEETSPFAKGEPMPIGTNPKTVAPGVLDNENFMSSDEFTSADDSNQWDMLVSRGIGADTATKWERESLFQSFDPLVRENGNIKNPNPITFGLPRKSCLKQREPLFPSAIDNRKNEEIDKLISIYTPPSQKGLFKVAPPGVETDLSGLGVPVPVGPICVMPPSLTTNYSQMNGSNNNETMIKEALAAQKEQYLTQLAEKDKQIEELQQAKMDIPMETEDPSASRILAEYEKTMSSYLEQIDELNSKIAQVQSEKQESQKERDQSVEDLKHVEDAFSLLHQKYERVKGTLENFKKNEEILKKRDQELIIKLSNRDKKIDVLKEESSAQMQILCQDFESKLSKIQNENVKLRALLRKNEVAMETLGQNLEQKQKENVELNKLCEELIGGGLSK